MMLSLRSRQVAAPTTTAAFACWAWVLDWNTRDFTTLWNSLSWAIVLQVVEKSQSTIEVIQPLQGKKKIITTQLPSAWIMSRSSSNSSNEKVHRAVFQNSPTWSKENLVWISLLWTTHHNTIFWVWGRFSQSPSERVLFSCSACYSAYLTEAYWEWLWDVQRSCCKFQTRINKTKSCDCHQQNVII